MLLLLGLAGCAGAPADTGGGAHDGGGLEVADGGGVEEADGGEVDGGAGGPDLRVDVLVIGAGPAGLAAAWEAEQAGASVLLVEREEALGGGGGYAGHFLAAGTPWQEALGFHDSPSLLLGEWSLITGGDRTDPWVIQFAEQSAATLQWLVDLGATVDNVVNDRTTGTLPRVHSLSAPAIVGEEGALVQHLAPLAWTRTEAVALRVEPDDARRVAGAWVEDLESGEVLEIAAASTVVATGGFARDPVRVEASRPELAGLTWVVEAAFTSDGGGHALLEAHGVAWQNPEGMGLYVHAAADPRDGYEGEALLLADIDRGLIVDTQGQRVGNEELALGFLLQQVLLDAPGRRLWLLQPESSFRVGGAWSFHRMLTDPGGEADLSPDALLELGVAVGAHDPGALAARLGVDPDALVATVHRYDDLCAAGVDSDFGKRSDALVAFLDQPVYAVELRPAAAKAFGGVALDLRGQVLDADGAAIPGLYAAGEVAGMLGTEAVGAGFSGSITAVYLTGRIAGQSAAEDAPR